MGSVWHFFGASSNLVQIAESLRIPTTGHFCGGSGVRIRLSELLSLANLMVGSEELTICFTLL